MQDNTFNGWKNYETWNVSLWVQNDEFFYSLAQESEDYQHFTDMLRDLGIVETPDKVPFNDSGLDNRELDDVIAGLKDE